MRRERTPVVSGFLSTRGSQIVNGNGDPILLRGVGLGNWLLPEGYMWRLPKEVDRPRRIERLISDLVGEASAQDFWRVFRDRFVTETDVARLAAQGFNSVRLPLNARTLLSSNESSLFDERIMVLVDRFVGWCREHGLYVILDLHGAPGGQTGANIDDSENDLPELFRSEEHAQRTVEVWQALASRYRDEWIVGGYDLLNEPLPNWFGEHNDQLVPLYARITDAIRSVDDRHMIILEGAHWATDWSVFQEPVGPNVMLEFHKYWNNPDRESLRPYLERREALNVPIFMGEGGENNTDWYAGAFRLFEDLDISWNFWTWKKMDTTNSPLSIGAPRGWSRITDYAAGGPRPEPDAAREILRDYLENVPSERCTHHPEVVDALFRRPGKGHAGLRIPAVFYAFTDRGDGFDGPPVDPTVDFRTTDRVPIVGGDEATGRPCFEHGGGEAWTEEEWLRVRLVAGAWVAYDIDAPGRCRVGVRCAGTPGSVLNVSVDDPEQSLEYSVGPDETDYSCEFAITRGMRRIVLTTRTGAILLKWLSVFESPADV